MSQGESAHATDGSDAKADLGVAICAHNSERTIGRTLQSVQGLARKIVVVDSGSTDRTVEICRSHGAQIVHKLWQGFVEQRRFATDLCRDHRFILALDSDESLEPQLQNSLRQALRDDDTAIDGWMINRKIWFLGGWLHHTFQPEWRLRLFRSGRGRVTGVNPHDRIEVEGRVGKLQGDLRHDSWADLNDMAQRHLRYAQIMAAGERRGGSAFSILFSPPAAMFKQLILRRGFRDGWRGVIAAGMIANSTLMKHLYIAANRRLPQNNASA